MNEKKMGKNLRQRLAICALLLTCQYCDASGFVPYDDRRNNNNNVLQPNQWPQAGAMVFAQALQPVGGPNPWFAGQPNAPPAASRSRTLGSRPSSSGNSTSRARARVRSASNSPSSHPQAVSNPWMRNNLTTYQTSYPRGLVQQQPAPRPWGFMFAPPSPAIPWPVGNAGNQMGGGAGGGYQWAPPANNMQNFQWQQPSQNFAPAQPYNFGWNQESPPIIEGHWRDITAEQHNQNWREGANTSRGNAAADWNASRPGGDTIHPATQVVQFDPNVTQFSRMAGGSNWPSSTNLPPPPPVEYSNGSNQWNQFQSGPPPPSTAAPAFNPWMMPSGAGFSYADSNVSGGGAGGGGFGGQMGPVSSFATSNPYGNYYR